MTTSTTQAPFDATTAATLMVEEFLAALVNVRIYAPTHPRVTNALAAVRKSVRELCNAIGREQLRITCAEGLLVFDRRPLRGASIGASRLLESLQQWRSGGIEFGQFIDEASLHEFFVALPMRPPEGRDYMHLNSELAAKNVRDVCLLPPYVDVTAPRGDGSAGIVGLRFYQNVIDLLQNVTVQVCRGGRIDFGPVEEHAERMLQRLEETGGPQLGLARDDQYDAFTFGHSMRVAILAINFAQTLTTDRALLLRIGAAALLHDVGKSLIPFEILHSSGTLSNEERVMMNQHAELGARCLLDHDDCDPFAVAAAFGHHRAPDGSGYPRTTHEHPVSLVTSIVKICDIFEALTAARPYKQPMSPIRAYRVMIAMGNKLDQGLLRRFIEVTGVYPVGQLVQLDTGDVAVVREQGADLLKPTVSLVQSMAGLDIVDDEVELFEVGDVACCSARSILRELMPNDASEQLVRQRDAR